MWLFVAQYKKMLALSLIPIIAVGALIGFEVFHNAEDRSQPLAVNAGMKDLLEDNKQQTSTPAPAKTKPAKAATSTSEPIPTSLEIEAVKLPEEPIPTQNPEEAKHTENPKTTLKATPKATPKAKAASKSKEEQNLKVNINKASPEELVQLKGIGESKAKAIVAYRTEHSFQVIEDLMKVKGIGPKIFANIKEQLEL